jgi:hypothetical protein
MSVFIESNAITTVKCKATERYGTRQQLNYWYDVCQAMKILKPKWYIQNRNFLLFIKSQKMSLQFSRKISLMNSGCIKQKHTKQQKTKCNATGSVLE